MSRLTFEAYLVRNRAEECDCDWCGCPIYTGDRVYALDESCTDVACSTGCGRKLAEHLTRARA